MRGAHANAPKPVFLFSLLYTDRSRAPLFRLQLELPQVAGRKVIGQNWNLFRESCVFALQGREASWLFDFSSRCSSFS